MAKVRVLYPTGLPDSDAEAGKVIDMSEKDAAAFVAAGVVEEVKAASKAPPKKADK